MKTTILTVVLSFFWMLSAVAQSAITISGGATVSGAGQLITTNSVTGGGAAPQSFSDDFNRANAATLGANWTDINGGMQIASNAGSNENTTTYDSAVWNTSCST